MKKNEIRDARSGNGRLVVGGLHADVLVVFRQTWFFSGAVVVVVEKRHVDDSFQTTTVTTTTTTTTTTATAAATVCSLFVCVVFFKALCVS